MKVTFITAIWKRPEITELFAKGIDELKRLNPKIQIEVCVAGSEGNESKSLCKRLGFNYVETNNYPLGNKMNKALKFGARTKADYYILLGSDDIINNDLFKLYLTYMKYGYDYIYLTDGYFYNTQTDELLYWGGYVGNRQGQSLGAGRVLSKNVMERVNFRCWRDGINKGLDSSFNQIVEPYICSKRDLNCKRDDVFIVDLKSESNITRFQVWENSKLINSNIIKEKFKHLWHN